MLVIVPLKKNIGNSECTISLAMDFQLSPKFLLLLLSFFLYSSRAYTTVRQKPNAVVS